MIGNLNFSKIGASSVFNRIVVKNAVLAEVPVTRLRYGSLPVSITIHSS
jgi:hypothetical protein